jgi:drug/metabolite transporter (DMT)-like permease
MNKKEIISHFLLLAVALIYGANYVWAKWIMPDPIPPNGFILLRAFGAVLLFWTFTRKHWTLPHPKDWPTIILCGATGIAINQLFFFNGLSLTAPIHAAIIMILTPIIVTAFSIFILKQSTSPQQWWGIIIGLVGAIGFIGYGQLHPMQGASFWGDFFILINAISYSIYLISVKPLMSKYHPLSLIPWFFTIGFIIIIPFGWQEMNQVNYSELSLHQWSILMFVILFVTFFTYLFNILAIRHLSPTIAGIYIYLQPPIAAVFSVMAGMGFSQLFNLPKLILIILIVVGIVLVSKTNHSKKS